MALMNCPLCGAYSDGGGTCKPCSAALGPSREVLVAALNDATARVVELEELLRWRGWEDEPPEGFGENITRHYTEGRCTHWRPKTPPEQG